VATFTGGQLALVLIFAVVWAVVGYLLTETDRRRLGRTPWGVPAMGWSAILFFTGLLGFVVWLVAHRSAVRRAANGPYGGPGAVPGGGGAAPPGPVASNPGRLVASDFPAYPRPASGGDAPGPGSNAGQAPPAPSPAVTVPTSAPADAAPPGWHPDPGGQYHYRWWTGSEWTSYVAVDGRVEVDISPDQRIGPY